VRKRAEGGVPTAGSVDLSAGHTDQLASNRRRQTEPSSSVQPKRKSGLMEGQSRAKLVGETTALVSPNQKDRTEEGAVFKRPVGDARRRKQVSRLSSTMPNQSEHASVEPDTPSSSRAGRPAAAAGTPRSVPATAAAWNPMSSISRLVRVRDKVSRWLTSSVIDQQSGSFSKDQGNPIILLYYAPPLGPGALSDDARLTSVCLSRTS